MRMTPRRTLREKLNLFYYNIFRFERYTQYLVSAPMHRFLKGIGLQETMERRTGRKDWDEHIMEVLNTPKGGFSTMSAGNHIATLTMLVAITILNLILGLLRLQSETLWLFGIVAGGIGSFALSYYIAPTNPQEYLKDFIKFESMSRSTKLRHALLTLLAVIAIGFACIASFVFYFKATRN